MVGNDENDSNKRVFTRGHTMLKIKLAKPMLVALAACAASVAFNGIVFADDAQTKALQDQMKAMQQQMQEMQKKLDALTKQQAAPPPVVQPVPVAPPPAGAGPAVAKEAPKEPKFEKFLSGFYGTLDVSFDDTTKGIDGLVAHHLCTHRSQQPEFRLSNRPGQSEPGGWSGGTRRLSAGLPTNKSVIGYRGSHKIDGGRDGIHLSNRGAASNHLVARA